MAIAQGYLFFRSLFAMLGDSSQIQCRRKTAPVGTGLAMNQQRPLCPLENRQKLFGLRLRQLK